MLSVPESTNSEKELKENKKDASHCDGHAPAEALPAPSMHTPSEKICTWAGGKPRTPRKHLDLVQEGRGDQGLILGWEDSLEEGMANHS